MSYTNGIGSAQLLLTAVSTTATAAASRVQADDAGSSGAIKASAGDDHTSFSAAASLMAQPSNGSDVRMEKVTALQQAIAAGTYNVPSSDVADKLMTVLSR